MKKAIASGSIILSVLGGGFFVYFSVEDWQAAKAQERRQAVENTPRAKYEAYVAGKKAMRKELGPDNARLMEKLEKVTDDRGQIKVKLAPGGKAASK